MTYLQLELTQITQVLENGLNNLQSQSGSLESLIDAQGALNTELPLVNTTLLSVLNLGEELNAALGTGSTSPLSAVVAYISQLNAQTDQLTISGSGSEVYVLTDGNNYVALPVNATVSQIQAALETLPTVGQNVTVTQVSSSGGITTFDVALQPEAPGPNTTSLDFPTLAAVALATPTVNGGTTQEILTVTGTGSFTIADGVGGTDVIGSTDTNMPAAGLGINVTQTTLVQIDAESGQLTFKSAPVRLLPSLCL